jgi:hypothetical protein
VTDLPFRWNLARRGQLGSLVAGEPAALGSIVGDIRECCARVVAQAGDSRLVFVGRSPESLYDYLAGALAETSWEERCTHLNLSMRFETAEEVAGHNLEGLRAVYRQFRALRLSPAEIAASERPVALVDLLLEGLTFGNVVGLLTGWAAREGVDPAAVRRRMRIVGITMRQKNSPNTWRWYQHVPWVEPFPRSALRGVSISGELWHYLGDWQDKVARWNGPRVWGTDEVFTPPRDPEKLQALRFAVALHEAARGREEQERFAAELAARPEMRHAWLRRLVLELRRG